MVRGVLPVLVLAAPVECMALLVAEEEAAGEEEEEAGIDWVTGEEEGVGGPLT